jgi:hypothetical protein
MNVVENEIHVETDIWIYSGVPGGASAFVVSSRNNSKLYISLLFVEQNWLLQGWSGITFTAKIYIKNPVFYQF